MWTLTLNPTQPIVTAHKRSLGQGNIFTPVCQSFCSQGGVPGQVHSPGPGTPSGPGTPPHQVHHPPDQVHPLGPGTPPWTRYTSHDQVHPWDQVHPRAVHAGDTGNKWVVRILLECILVVIKKSQSEIQRVNSPSDVEITV